MPKVELEIVMTLSLAEATTLRKALATFDSSDPSDPIYRALVKEMDREEDQ